MYLLYSTERKQFSILCIFYTYAFYHTLRIFRSTQLLPHYDNNSLGKTGQNQHSVLA